MTEITPVRNFRRAMLCFQSLSWKSCRSSVCLGILLLQCLCLAVEIQSKSCIPKSCHETVVSANWNFKHVLHSCMFKWDVLLKPLFRLLRKHPCFAPYPKIHFAEGTYLECCTWPLRVIAQEMWELWLQRTPGMLQGLAGTLLLYYSIIIPKISLPWNQGASFVPMYHSP